MEEQVIPPMHWFWTPDISNRRNRWVRFRCNIDNHPQARLRITADSRYWLWVNGHYVGFGPVRGWPEHWQVDEYAIGHLLKPKGNIVAVLAQHFGEGNFQYINAPAGLAAEYLAETTLPLTGWRCAPCPFLESHTVRVSLQESFEEHVDARLEDAWKHFDYDDSAWSAAVLAPEADRDVSPRDIPFLSREPVLPKRLVTADILGPRCQVWTLDLKPLLTPSDHNSNAMMFSALVHSWVYSPVRQTIQLIRPHRHESDFKLNRKTVRQERVPDPAGMCNDLLRHQVTLEEGWNNLLFPVPGLFTEKDGTQYPGGDSHMPVFTLTIRSEQPLRWSCNKQDGDAPWALLGPFDLPPLLEEHMAEHSFRSTAIFAEYTYPHEPARTVWDAGEPTEPECNAPWFQPLPGECLYENDVFAKALGDLPTEALTLKNPEGFLNDTGEPLVLPICENAMRLLIDFGDEIVGPQTFSLDASEGTIIEVHNFEFIQPDGHHNLPFGMNNSFRYICREGFQEYETLQRRGFRYSWIIVHGHTRPVRLFRFAAIMSTYPQRNIGGFHCNDELLNTIWKVGAHTLRCCAEDTYTDCPTYEQTHWVGDARNEALVDWVVNGDPRLWFHCLLQIGQSLERFPITSSHLPSSWENLLPAWSFLWMRSCREYLLYTGDYEGARELLPWIKRNVNGIKDHLNKDGLFEIEAWNLFDWAAMDTPTRGVVTHQNCLAVHGLRDCAELAEWLEQGATADEFRKIANELAADINTHLWSDERQAYIDCIHHSGRVSEVYSQQTQTAAVCSGVATGARYTHCRELVANPPKGFVCAGSPFFAFFMLELFAAEKNWQRILEQIRKDWGFMIAQGATTFWEMWSLSSGRLTRSHCHGWSSAPTFFLSTGILGIKPLSPGFKRIAISRTAIDLEHIQGRIPTPYGLIEIRYWHEDGELKSWMNIPGGIEVIRE